ncbi:hypothetical protein GWK47_023392 [Chionoecetes opilio]|uniref:Uncharacterized protein n=1 Tax=Chionoecetes opilio TaxID=41210 RepID=A0A8J4XWA7_CHIOP|nr:hypothetical protein GWK47_023392 [Chionoecetes opilio]
MARPALSLLTRRRHANYGTDYVIIQRHIRYEQMPPLHAVVRAPRAPPEGPPLASCKTQQTRVDISVGVITRLCNQIPSMSRSHTPQTRNYVLGSHDADNYTFVTRNNEAKCWQAIRGCNAILRQNMCELLMAGQDVTISCAAIVFCCEGRAVPRTLLARFRGRSGPVWTGLVPGGHCFCEAVWNGLAQSSPVQPREQDHLGPVWGELAHAHYSQRGRRPGASRAADKT